MISSDDQDRLLSSLGIGNLQDLNFLSEKFGESTSSLFSGSTPVKLQGRYPFYNLVEDIRSEVRSKSTYKRVFEETCNFRPRWNHVVQYISKDHMTTPLNKERKGENMKLKRVEDLKKEGNECYGRKHFKEAVRIYTIGIQLAGSLKEPGTLTAILLGNRSASFYQLRDYQTSLGDIKGAFHFGYPPELQHKLIDRRARCRFALGDALEDIRSEIIEAHAVDSKNLMASFETFVSSYKSNPKATSKKAKNQKSLIEDILDFPRHERVPQLARYVDIIYTNDLGRHGLALRDIQPGEPILYERPFVFHCSPSYSEEHCYDCGVSLNQNERLLGIFPHLSDEKSRFCSWLCFENWVNSSGNYETKFDINSLFRGVSQEETRSSGAVNLAYEALIRHSYDYYAKTMMETKGSLIPVDPEFGSSNSQKHYVSTDVRTLYDLEGHRNSRKDDEESLTLLVHTWILLQCLKKSDYFPSSGGDPDFIAELIHHFLVGIKYNLHSVDRVKGDMGRIQARGPIAFESIGSGIFPTLLLLNHSCATNTIRINLKGSHVLVLAKSFIPAGAEVTDCYGAHHLSANTDSRRRDLLRGYNFDCRCLACSGGDKNYPRLGSLGAPLRGKEEAWESYVRGFVKDIPRKSFERILEYLKSFVGGSPDRNLEKGGIALSIVMWKAINGNQ